EQTYFNVSPLELMFYTGDFKMWDRVLPLIPQNMIADVLKVMAKVKRGGPDLVKIDRYPRTLTLEQLKHFNAGNDEQENPIIYDLLKNPDGIICWPQRDSTMRYFYA